MRELGLAIFGGTFDPVHKGHFQILDELERCPLIQEIVVVPNAIPPHKTAQATSEQRLMMISLLVDEFKNPLKKISVSEIELRREGPSFMVDTLKALAAQNPQKKLYLVMGSDSFLSLHTWKNPEQILEMAVPLVIRRGAERQDDFLAYLNSHFLNHPEIAFIENNVLPVSSGQLREAFLTSTLTAAMLTWIPESVRRYIAQEGLYQ